MFFFSFATYIKAQLREVRFEPHHTWWCLAQLSLFLSVLYVFDR